jgi:hypothetical protein
MTSKCGVSGCKRDFDTVCTHCQTNVCSKHYIEHIKLANDELVPLADRLNSIVNLIQQLNPVHQAFEQLEQWREISHCHIDKLCDEKKRQLKTEVEQTVEIYMKKVRELSQQVKELIDEGDASFKQIENIKRDINECQKQCKEFETGDYIHVNLKPIEIEMTIIYKQLFSGGTLLVSDQQMKLNEFYGKENQRWLLIYKATRDGFGSNDFHRCCDNRGPTMTVIRSKDDGYVFGGYTSVSWRSIGSYVEDRNGPFLFTLINPHSIPPTKYPIKNTKHSICDITGSGPTFGYGFDLLVCDNSQTKTGSSISFPHSYIDTTNRASMTFTGNANFQTSDIEVYRLLKH